MTENTKIYDPWESAWDAQPRVYSNEVYGEVTITMNPVVLVKGVGKVDFNPGVHKDEDRRTSINVSVLPLPESKFNDPISRDMLAESNDWAKITLPSVKSLGVSGLRDLSGKFVKAKLIPNGQKFPGRDGVEREKTVFSFLTVFANEQECRAAFHENNDDDEQYSAEAATPTNSGNDSGKETAEQFLTPVVKNCCQGAKSKDEAMAKVATSIADMPMINKYYTVSSPEVIALIDQFMAG